MDVTLPLPLLGGLSAQQFMRRYWQKKPLLVRQALPGFKPLLGRAQLLELASRDDVESRLVVQDPALPAGWQLTRGPLPRRSLPPLKQPRWTALVQGVDLHDARVHALMQCFRFVPDARLDDLMISYATDAGGVGPHFDSYDVFLLQAHGQRRWRYGRQKNLSLQPDVPLKILTHFEPECDELLQAGDLLYLPPGWAHDGIAVGECMTYSVGFRIPNRAELAREALLRLADAAVDTVGERLYRDPQQPATETPAAIPTAMRDFAQQALREALADPLALARALGEYLTEPKAEVWFAGADSSADPADWGAGVQLDRRSRMLYDEAHLFINGESFCVGGRDADVLRQLADARAIDGAACKRLSAQARRVLAEWVDAGWVQRA